MKKDGYTFKSVCNVYMYFYLLYPFQNILNFESRFKNVILINNFEYKGQKKES